jgi:methyl-accepting chemotaxis protein
MQNYNFNKTRFLLKYNNIANGLESKAYNFVGNSDRLSSAKYPSDEIIGTVRRNYTKTLDNFKEQIDEIKGTSAGINAIQNLNIAAEKKVYISNLNQESMNSVMNQLEVLNKMSQKLYQDILLLKSQSINKNGVYPSSKYR